MEVPREMNRKDHLVAVRRSPVRRGHHHGEAAERHDGARGLRGGLRKQVFRLVDTTREEAAAKYKQQVRKD